METREILIANTKTQKRYKLMSSATTLNELMIEMSNQGIDFNGMSFTEGISNTQLLDNSSQLPSNLNYKGKVTNNLVILLTNTNKNIESGATERSRKVAYILIKKLGLQDSVKSVTGRNYTQVPTCELNEIIDKEQRKSQTQEEVPMEISTETPAEEAKNTPAASYISTLFMNIIEYFVKSGAISVGDLEYIKTSCTDLADACKVEVTEDDVQDMIERACQ